jgi:tripartite-type tricarboxylate transporter receptor subunit TctC
MTFKAARWLAALTLGFCICGAASAQDYPAKSIRLIVPYPPGGGSDLVARPIAQKLGEKWGQSVIVDNHAGATGMIGTELAARSPADGYTLLLGSVAELALNGAVYKKMTYDSERDFTPVTLLAISPLVLVVNPSLPVHDVRELIALAKQHPGEIGYATAGNGSPHHIAGEWVKLLAHIDLNHVPYKGGGPQLVDLMGGHVQSGFLALPVAMPQVKLGKLRALAVTSARRSQAVPEVPSADESGLAGLDVNQWWGIFVPAATPPAIVAKLQKALVEIINMPDIRSRLADLGADPVGDTPAEFSDFVRSESAKFKRIVGATNISVN